jgi:hypothetical protein
MNPLKTENPVFCSTSIFICGFGPGPKNSVSLKNFVFEEVFLGAKMKRTK